MAGSIIQILPKCNLDFSALRTSTTEDVVLADHVDLVPWREVTVRTRVHSNAVAASAGNIQIMAVPQSWAPDDPGLTFLETTLAAAATIDSTVPVPSLFNTALATAAAHGFADGLRILARGSRSAAGTIRAELSIELEVKS